MKRYIWPPILIIFLILAGYAVYSVYYTNREQAEARQVLERFLQAQNDNDYQEQLRCLSTISAKNLEEQRMKFGFIGMAWRYFKINKISLDNSKSEIESYLTHGHGEITRPYKVIIFDVNFEAKFGPHNGGVDGEILKATWKYFLIKEKENDPWKVDCYGV